MPQIRLPGTVIPDTLRGIQTRTIDRGRGGRETRYVVNGREYTNRAAAEAAAGSVGGTARGGGANRGTSPGGGRGGTSYDGTRPSGTSRGTSPGGGRGGTSYDGTRPSGTSRGTSPGGGRGGTSYDGTTPSGTPNRATGSGSGRGIGGSNLFGRAISGLIPGTITAPNEGGTAPTPSGGGGAYTDARRRAELQIGIPRDQRRGERGPVGQWRGPAGQSQARQPLPGLRDRTTVDSATSGAANAISQAAAAARSTGGVGPGSGNFGTNVGGRGVTTSIEGREAISTGVGPQFQLDQLQVNQDLQGRAVAQSTAAHGIRADLPGRVAAQRLTEGRGRTRGRASTILTSGGARGLGSTPANTLGARRLVSGRAPATPVEGTQAGEAAAAQAGVQQRQGILAEQDRAQAQGAALRNTPQTSDTRSAGARRTSRREALIGGTSVGGISGGAGVGGAGASDSSGGEAFGPGLLAQDGGDPRLGAARRPRPGSRDQTARATGQAAASRSRQGGRPPQRGNVPERVRARRTLLGGG